MESASRPTLCQDKKENSEEQGARPIPRDEEDALVAVHPSFNHQLSLVGALEDKRYVAFTKIDDIKDIARVLRQLGDNICLDYEKKWKLSLELKNTSLLDKVIGKLKNVITVVDDVLEYLEYAGLRLVQNVKEKESVLRGIFRYSEIAFQYEIFTFLKVLAQSIDVPEDPYSAERNHIIKSLESIESNETAIINLVEEAGQILTEIIKEERLDVNKARAFDDIVRKANLEINSCKRTLDRIESVIRDLIRKANTAKWISRAVRLSGLGISWAYLYEKYNSSHVSLPVALGGGLLCGFMWLSLFPSRSYELMDSMRKIQFYHQSLSDKLKNLHESLESGSSQKIALMTTM